MSSKHITKDDRCFICGFDIHHLLDGHHIVPRRYGGSDEGFNIVPLCKNCHGAVERIYTDFVFERLGVSKEHETLPETDEMSVEQFEGLDVQEQFEYLHRHVSETPLRNALERIYHAELCDKQDIGDEKIVDDERDSLRDTVKERIQELQEKYPDSPGAPEDELIENLSGELLSSGKVVSDTDIEDAIRGLRDRSKIYSPDPDHYLAV